MLKTIYPLLLFSLINIVSHAQISTLLAHNDTLKVATLTALEDITYPARGAARMHDFYIDKTFSNGYVLNQKGEVIHLSGRYNVLKKSIETRWGDEIRIVKLPKIKLAQLGNTTLIVVPKSLRTQVDNNSFVEVIEQGKVNLIRSYCMASKMELGGSLSMQVDGKKVYYVDEKLYLTTDFQSFTPFSKNKFLGLSNFNRKSIEQYVKSENLRWNKVDDVRKIVQKSNGLDTGE